MTQSFHKIGRLFVLVVIALACIAGAAGTDCWAAPLEIVVVQGANIKPFEDALEGFESACECTITEVITIGSGTTDIVSRVRRLHPDAILALGIDALAKVQSIRDIPIFYTMTAGARHPYQEIANLSGVSMFITPERQIDAIRELFPNAKRIGMLYDARNSSSIVERSIQYARSNNMEIVAKQAGSPREIPALLESLKGRIDVLLMLPDMTVTKPETINSMLLFSFTNRVPIFTFSEKYVAMGAVAALMVTPRDLGAQTGEIARTLLHEKTRSGPVKAYSRNPVLVVNTKVAKKMGLVIAEETLKRSLKVN